MSTKPKGATPAISSLREAEVSFRLHSYAVDYEAAPDYGTAVAEQLGVPPQRLFKTLVVYADGKPMVGLVSADARLSVKKLARAVDARKARMASPREAERLTGYVPGGISPFGLRRRMATAVDESALSFETIWVSAGKRGLQIEIDPAVLVLQVGAVVAPLAFG